MNLFFMNQVALVGNAAATSIYLQGAADWKASSAHHRFLWFCVFSAS
jgi:hypothetical protein